MTGVQVGHTAPADALELQTSHPFLEIWKAICLICLSELFGRHISVFENCSVHIFGEPKTNPYIC